MNKNKSLRVWLGCVLLKAGATGIILNCYTVFYASLAGELALSNADVSLITTVRMIFMSLGMLMANRLYNKFGFKTTLAIASLIQGGLFCLQALFNNLTQFLIVSVIIGFVSGCLITIPSTIMVNNWFKERQGFFLGMALAASGIMGAIYSPLISLIISNNGWRMAVVITGIITFIIDEIAVYGFCNLKPDSEKEMYGTRGSVNAASGGNSGTNLSLVLAIILMIVVMATQQLTFQFSLFASQIGLSITQGALLNTACMIGNTSGKVAIGYLKDKIGTYKTISLTMLLIALALLGLASGNMINLCAGLVGMTFSLSAIIPSFVARELFIDRYDSVTGKLSGFGTLIGSMSGYLIGYLSDVLNGYGKVFMAFAIICLLTQGIIILLSNGGKKHVTV